METPEAAETGEAGDVRQGRGVPGFRLAARDPLFALVLVILAVAVGGMLAVGKNPPAAAVVPAALLWGVVRLRQWALWATVVLGSIQVFYLLLVLLDVVRGSAGASLMAIPINVFVLWVLIARRGLFVRGL